MYTKRHVCPQPPNRAWDCVNSTTFVQSVQLSSFALQNLALSYRTHSKREFLCHVAHLQNRVRVAKSKKIDMAWEVLKFTKRGSDYRWDVFKFVKLGSQKCWVYDNSQKKVVKRLGVLTMPALKYCILRRWFFEMFDSLAIITSFGGLRTRAPLSETS